MESQEKKFFCPQLQSIKLIFHWYNTFQKATKFVYSNTLSLLDSVALSEKLNCAFARSP